MQLIYYHLLSLTHQQIAHPLHYFFSLAVCWTFVQKDSVRNSIESFSEIRNDYINYLNLVNQVVNLVIKGDYVH